MSDEGIDPFAFDTGDEPTPKPSKPVVFSERSKAIKALSNKAKTPQPLKLPGIRRAPPAAKQLEHEDDQLEEGQGVGLPRTAATARPGAWDVTTRRVFIALTNPTWRLLDDKEKAKRCGVSLRKFNAIRARPDFAPMLNALIIEEMRGASHKFADSVLVNMERPGREGYQDRKLFAIMTGLMPNGKTVTHQGQVNVTHNVGSKLAAALARARAAEKAAREAQDVGNGQPIIDLEPGS